MAKKKGELSDNQKAMLHRLKKHSEEKPFLPKTSVEQRTCDSLDSRGLLDGKLVLACANFQRGSATYKRAVWLKDVSSDE